MPDPLLSVEGLTLSFQTSAGFVKAIDNVSFSLKKGEILGIVGESGCGKSVTAQSIMGLVNTPPGRIDKGKIIFDGEDLLTISPRKMTQIRGNRIAMIFQEPMTSFNPLKTIGYQIGEMFWRHKNMGKKQGFSMAGEMLKKVQIPEPVKRTKSFPHEMSGGMRQLAMIAMALSCRPEILIADEPTTALDVTVQAQIMDLLQHISKESGTAILLITHDLGLIADVAHRVMVMYAGKVVEAAPVKEIFENPCHPYTRGLLNSMPAPQARQTGKRKRLTEIKGMVPSLGNLPTGCSFHPRCPEIQPGCSQNIPCLIPKTEAHWVRCIQ